MEQLGALVTVLGIGLLEIWAAVPAGFVLGLAPVTIILASALGGIVGVLVTTFLGDGARAWLPRRLHRGGAAQDGSLRRAWDHFGAVELGLAAPLIVGAPIGVIIGHLSRPSLSARVPGASRSSRASESRSGPSS